MKSPKMKPAISIMIAFGAMLLLSSCSGDDNSTNSGGTTNPPPANTVDIPGLSFNPGTLTVKVGTKITWTNNDSIAHTVTSDDGAFTSSGTLANGDTYEYTFNVVGDYPYHCAIHPAMTGTITVTP